jgi:hypothetical protein
MNRFIINTLFAVSILVGLVSCGNSSSRDIDCGYDVTCTVDKSLRKDSATLFILENQYGKLRKCDAEKSDRGVFSFMGQVDSPHVAFLKFNKDSEPLYFIIERGRIEIFVENGRLIIKGGALNHEYMSFMLKRLEIRNERKSIRHEYLRLVADSTLTRAREISLVKNDRHLADSLQRMTLHLINRGDAASIIVKATVGNDLDKRHLAKMR